MKQCYSRLKTEDLTLTRVVFEFLLPPIHYKGIQNLTLTRVVFELM